MSSNVVVPGCCIQQQPKLCPESCAKMCLPPPSCCCAVPPSVPSLLARCYSVSPFISQSSAPSSPTAGHSQHILHHQCGGQLCVPPSSQQGLVDPSTRTWSVYAHSSIAPVAFVARLSDFLHMEKRPGVDIGHST
mmetsp:Transcript_118789/g.206870  ORF Transcript_118789/g.206870 Transcript_118789/m.206870 type:complete len:135 (+) Transcript_118789:1019-1423(+)